jgi:hypothetical protein
MNHRTPPKPEAWDAEPGVCRWCGCCIFRADGTPAFRRSWHKGCAEEYKGIFWPQVTVKRLLKARGWVCEDCGKDFKSPAFLRDPKDAYEHHHIIPLIQYQHDPQDPYAAWREGNLALLCHACHMRRHHPVKPILAERQRRLFA